MSDIDRVKEAVDIVDVIESYVELKRAGSNLKGLCPFHTEKTPSFMVSPSLQIFKCFGCGKGGDVIKFIQEIENLEFREALEKLAQIAGIELENKISKNPKTEQEKERILKANYLTKNFYHKILLNKTKGKKGRNYAIKRELNKEMVVKFEIGYAPPDGQVLTNYLLSQGFTSKELVKWGLAVVRNGELKDKFRDRLIQPIFSENGDVVGFSGRYIGENEKAPKYLNSPETLVFKKNSQLYSLYHAKDAIRKTKKAIIVEGNLDVISAHKIGSENIVAPLGTAFTVEQAKILKRYANEVLLCFDNDNAGFLATIRALEILEKLEIDHKTIKIEKYTDADEVIKNDVELWKKIVDNPVNTLEFILEKISSEYDLNDVDGKSSLYKKFLPILNLVKNKVQKEHYTNKLSELVGLNVNDIYDDINQKTSKNIKKIEAKNNQNINLEFQVCSLIAQKHLDEISLLEFISNLELKNACQKIIDQNEEINMENFNNQEKEIIEKLLLNDTSSINHKNLIRNFIDSKIKEIAINSDTIEKIQFLTKLKKKYT
ncbi:MAG: hypothetical protein KatS3mg086_056 [Candidatus Dojkabacteria bacterium]|nr:MAG: hypothetical protein KatS3mg086_056 [Candidatus Dojkabacteria bacterium]